MAEATEKLTTNPAPEPITIPEAMELLVAEGLDNEEARLALTGALLSGGLRAGDQKGPNHFRELAINLDDLASRGVAKADLTAISRLSRGLAISWENWRRWIVDGSVDWKSCEIVRDLAGHTVIFTPVFRREDLLSIVPRFGSLTSAATRPASADAIRKAVRTVYSGYPKREGPNLNEVVPRVQALLHKAGCRASKQRIQDIAAEPEFSDRRREPGKHHKRRTTFPGK